MDSVKNNLFRCVNGSWYKFRQIQQRTKRRGVQDRFKYYVPLIDPPSQKNLVKTSVQSVHGAFITQGYNIEMNAVSAVKVEEASLETLIGVLGAREGEQWELRNIKNKNMH